MKLSNKITSKTKKERIQESDAEKPMILRPYMTEKSFNLIEKEKKLTFIVSEKSNKNTIKQELKELYEADIDDINTARTIDGKKAFAKFKTIEAARDLATKLGLV